MGHGAEQEKAFTPLLSRSSSFFFSLFYPFLRERETVVLFEKESLERGKCACLIVCREWGVQEGKMEFAVVGRAVVTRQQSGLLVLQYT